MTNWLPSEPTSLNKQTLSKLRRKAELFCCFKGKKRAQIKTYKSPFAMVLSHCRKGEHLVEICETIFRKSPMHNFRIGNLEENSVKRKKNPLHFAEIIFLNSKIF